MLNNNPFVFVFGKKGYFCRSPLPSYGAWIMDASLESLPRDIFEIFASQLHFTDVIALLRVSKTVRQKLIASQGAWKSISFAVLPVSDRSKLSSSWAGVSFFMALCVWIHMFYPT